MGQAYIYMKTSEPTPGDMRHSACFAVNPPNVYNYGVLFIFHDDGSG